MSFVGRLRRFAGPRAPALDLTHDALLSARPRRAIGGFVDERSMRHVRGWMWDEADAAARVPFEVTLDGRVLAAGIADEPSPHLRRIGVGDGAHGFTVYLDPPLDEAARARVTVRDALSGHVLPLAPGLKCRFAPVSHVALDVVDNCNLRCPFCVYDYDGVRKTNLMDEATFDAALRFAEYVDDGAFWLSCWHEPTLHPRLLDLIARVPADRRRRLMLTTNLARRLPDAFFAALAGSGLDHVTISLESVEPAVYERLRRGARFDVFQANWTRLLAAFDAPASPALHYIVLAFRSNAAALPGLVARLLQEGRASRVEVRAVFDVASIPDWFRQEEYLDAAGWAALARALAGHDPSRLTLSAPQPPAEPFPEASAAMAPRSAVMRPLQIRVKWDGSMLVYGETPGVGGRPPTHENYVATNVRHIRDPLRFVLSL
jgi:hypothetical protein